MFWGTNSSRGSFDIAASTLSSWMPRGLSCSSTIFCRSAANSGLEVTFWWQPLVTRSATTRDCETRLIINITQQTGVSAATNYSCPSCFSWLISPALHERAFVIPSPSTSLRINSVEEWSEWDERHGRLRCEGSSERVGRRTSSISYYFCERGPQNTGNARADDGHRTAPPFRVARPCDGNFEDLAGSAVRRRAAGRERFLLRCRSSAPDLAGRFRENRGGNEEGDQSESFVRAHGSFEKRSARPWKERTPGRADRSQPAE